MTSASDLQERPATRRLLRLRDHSTATAAGARRSAMGLVLLVAGVLCVAVALVAVVCHFVPMGTTYLLGLVAFSPFLLLAAPIGGVLLILAKARRAAIVAAVVAFAGTTLQVPLFIATTAPSGVTLKAMALNMKLGGASTAAIVSMVRSKAIDVLMLEELTPEARARLQVAGLDQALAYNVTDTRPDARGIGLWSRYPLSNTKRLKEFTFAFVSASMKVDGVPQEITVAAAHMAGPYPGPTTYWSRDIHHLPSLLKTFTGTALVGGDFNATNDTVQFRHALVNGFQDAAAQAGAGLVRTWPADLPIPPSIAIDHFLARTAVATSVTTAHIAGTDHLAVVSALVLPR